MRLNCPACLELANETSQNDNYKGNSINSNINYSITIIMYVFKGGLGS